MSSERTGPRRATRRKGNGQPTALRGIVAGHTQWSDGLLHRSDLPAVEFQDDECIEDAETAVTTVKKSLATITGEWLQTKANHRGADSEQDGFPGLWTSAPGSARLESRASVSIRRQSALHPWGFSPRPSFGRVAAAVLGVDVGLQAGFPGPERTKPPLRFQRMSVSGLTTTRASRQSNQRLKAALTLRVASSTR